MLPPTVHPYFEELARERVPVASSVPKHAQLYSGRGFLMARGAHQLGWQGAIAALHVQYALDPDCAGR
jgi:hypothetical protein